MPRARPAPLDSGIQTRPMGAGVAGTARHGPAQPAVSSSPGGSSSPGEPPGASPGRSEAPQAASRRRLPFRLTLVPIWFPHCPAWMCTISLMAAAARPAVRPLSRRPARLCAAPSHRAVLYGLRAPARPRPPPPGTALGPGARHRRWVTPAPCVTPAPLGDPGPALSPTAAGSLGSSCPSGSSRPWCAAAQPKARPANVTAAPSPPCGGRTSPPSPSPVPCAPGPTGAHIAAFAAQLCFGRVSSQKR